MFDEYELDKEIAKVSGEVSTRMGKMAGIQFKAGARWVIHYLKQKQLEEKKEN